MEENRLREETPDREAKGAPAESSVRVETRERTASRESGSEPAVSFPCGRAGVEALLPHRDPFIWVSHILACEPGVSITAELDVDPALPLFAGHFPSHRLPKRHRAACCPDGAGPARSAFWSASTRRSSAPRCIPATRCASKPASYAILHAWPWPTSRRMSETCWLRKRRRNTSSRVKGNGRSVGLKEASWHRIALIT